MLESVTTYAKADPALLSAIVSTLKKMTVSELANAKISFTDGYLNGERCELITITTDADTSEQFEIMSSTK
jgi:hypothetical protein